MMGGEIHYKNLSNSLFVVKITNGKYAVFESFDLNDFRLQDKVAGKFDSRGSIEVLNATSQKKITVIIKDTDLGEVTAIHMVDSY
jgi:hypothetical protein